LFAGLALAIMDSPTVAVDGWLPDAENVGKLEAQVKFPDIHKYARYYSGFFFATGKPMIKGEMIKPKREGDLPSGIYIVPSLPVIRDGTCDVVHVIYVVESEKVIFEGCGGPPTQCKDGYS